MKRNISGKIIALLIVLLTLLCACGTQPAPMPTPAPTPVISSAPEPEPTPAPEKSREELIYEAASELLSAMTVEEKVYQLFVTAPEGLPGVSGTVTAAGDELCAALERCPVGGLILFGANIIDRQQTAGLISGAQSVSKLGLFIGVDEEGGMVSRLGNKPAMETTAFPDMREIGDTGDVTRAYEVGLTIGKDISALGFNVDFAPVADVDSNPANPVIGTRAFSSDAQTASQMVAACVAGFLDSGVLCTLKHFPGHGDTATDSHYGSAQVNKSLDELRQCELLPFAAGISVGAPMVMIGHISLPEITGSDQPATLSYEIVTQLLRDELGFDGLVITDALNMSAVSGRYSSKEAAVLAVNAGCDLLLMPYSLTDAAEGILEALDSGEISPERLDESVLRILEAKLRSGVTENGF